MHTLPNAGEIRDGLKFLKVETVESIQQTLPNLARRYNFLGVVATASVTRPKGNKVGLVYFYENGTMSRTTWLGIRERSAS